MKDLILKTSLKLFSEKGIHKTTISDITNDCGISKGLLYQYFGGKSEIVNVINEQNIPLVIAGSGLFTDDKIDDPALIIDKTIRIIKMYSDYWRFTFEIVLNRSLYGLSSNLIINKIDKPYIAIWKNYFSAINLKNAESASLSITAQINSEIFGYLYKGHEIDKSGILNLSII